MQSFDPYLNWLGIPPHEQPPNYYRLLGIVLFESNPQLIEQAADQQSLRVGAYQSGPQVELCHQLMSEIAMARFCLSDPQQKAAYDFQLNQAMAQRGECAVAAAPPPGGTQPFPASSSFGSPSPQFAQQPPQFGVQPPVGEVAVSSPPPPGGTQSFPSQMPFGQPSSPFGQQPADFPQQGPSFGPPAGMPAFAPTGGMPSPMPAGFPAAAPVMMPAASPFPSPAAAPAGVAAPVAAKPAAPPRKPPAAPQRPIDELESLTSAPTTRRRLLKKRTKVDHTKEFIIAGVVGAGAALLLMIYLAVKSQDPSEHGFNVIKPDTVPESVNAKLAEEHKKKLKDIEAAKQAEKKKAAEARAAANSGDITPLKPLDRPSRRPKPAVTGDGDTARLRPFDDSGPVRPAETGPRPEPHDTPLDLGGDNDPVMGPPEK